MKREPIFGMQRGAAGPTARTTIESSFTQGDIGVTVAGLTWSGGVIGAAQTLDLVAADGTFAGKYYVDAVDTNAHTVSLSLLVTAAIGLGDTVPAGCYALSSGSPGADGASGVQTPITFTFTHADLTEVGNNRQTLTFVTPMPAGSRILFFNPILDTTFSGGGAATVACTLGRAGATDVYGSIDLFGAPIDGLASYVENRSIHKKFTVETYLVVEVTTDVDTADLDAGSATIEVVYVLEP